MQNHASGQGNKFLKINNNSSRPVYVTYMFYQYCTTLNFWKKKTVMKTLIADIV